MVEQIIDERVIVWKTYGVTELDPLTLATTIVLLGLAIFGNPRRALAPFLIALAILPSAQRLVIGDMDFPMVRLIMTLAWIPLLIGKTGGPFRWTRLNLIDRSLIAWALSGALVYMLRHGDGAGIAYKAGVLLDAFGLYFLVRQKVWRSDQFVSGMVVCAWLAVLLGVAMGIEYNTGRNHFSIFGSASEVTTMRNGEFRAESSFAHPIMAGTFGSLILPLMIGLWNQGRKYRVPAALGFVGAIQMVLASNSSGPLIAALFGIGCWGAWHFRIYLTQLCWTAVILAIIVHFIREKPLWHLILRAGEVMGGGTGYHRYYLIDATVNNWNQWVAIGTDNAASWGWGLQDLTNQWVFEAVNGGLITLLAFNFLLFVCFRGLGRTFATIRRTDERTAGEKSRLLFLGWTQGVVLSVFCMSFLSVALFGQMNAFFYIQLALISNFTELPEIGAARSVAGRVRKKGTRREPAGSESVARGLVVADAKRFPSGSAANMLTGRATD